MVRWLSSGFGARLSSNHCVFDSSHIYSPTTQLWNLFKTGFVLHGPGNLFTCHINQVHATERNFFLLFSFPLNKYFFFSISEFLKFYSLHPRFNMFKYLVSLLNYSYWHMMNINSSSASHLWIDPLQRIQYHHNIYFIWESGDMYMWRNKLQKVLAKLNIE